MTNSSEQLNELFAALAKAQGQMQSATLNQSNPYFKSRYADFSELIKASRPALAENGLCVIQRVVDTENGQVLSSVLGHSSGQWVESTMRIAPAKSDVQSMGSYITYLKRYSYAALVGVATDDDDGEQAMVQIRQQPQIQRPSPHEKITLEQLEQLEIELEDELELAGQILERMGLDQLADMPKNKFLGALNRVREIKQLKKES